MALLPAKCTECGGFVEVDNEKRLGVCQHCGNPFVIEEAVNNFNTTYNITNNYSTTNNYAGAVVNVYEDSSKDFVIEGGVLKKYQGESLTPVIPEGVIAIEADAFKGSMITKVTLPSTLKEVRLSTVKTEIVMVGPFYSCKQLKEAVFADGTEKIHGHVLRFCKALMSVTIPDRVTSIGEFAFGGCTSLTSIVIPEGVTNISSFAFEDCTGLTSITIPDSVTSIGNKAFFGTLYEKTIIERKRYGYCQHCGGYFKGLFNKTCTKCGKPKDY